MISLRDWTTVTKILYSPGFGAGWVTWVHSGNKLHEEFFLTYKPLIDALEAGEDIGYRDKDPYFTPGSGSPLEQFFLDFMEKFGAVAGQSVYLGGARDLCVYEVSGPFRVEEYDGAESVTSFDPGHYYFFEEKIEQLEKGDDVIDI